MIGIVQDNGGFDEAENRALDVIQAAESRLGDARFGGAWLDRSNGRSPAIRIAAVDPSQADVDAILACPRPAGWRISVSMVRYSRAELIAFYEYLVPPPGGAASSVGWDVRQNRVVVSLKTLDVDTVRYFRERIPDDALQFVVEPGWFASAYTDMPK